MAHGFPNGIDLFQTALLNAVLHPLAADPPGPVDGQVWFNSTEGVFKARLAGANVRFGRLDQMSAPQASLAMNNQRITGLADGVAGTDAATLQQVQNLVSALSSNMAWKDSVRVTVSTNVNLASPGSTLDGVAFAAGDANKRVLLIGQTNGAENGIWDWNGAATPMTRSADASTSQAISGALVPVEQGSQADTGWALTTDSPTLGTTALSFTRIYGASSGPKKYVQTYGAQASQLITHNLGTQDLVWRVKNLSNNNSIEPDVVPVDNSSVNVIEAVAPAANSRRITLMG